MPYTEEVPLGTTARAARRTTFTHDITNFAYVLADWHPFHTDEAFARNSDFDGIIAARSARSDRPCPPGGNAGCG